MGSKAEAGQAVLGAAEMCCLLERQDQLWG